MELDEIDAVRKAACEGLRSGGFIDDTGWPLCRFVVLPSFENPMAWDVRCNSAESRLFRSCWRQDLDLDALGSPVERPKHPRHYRPTVEVASVAIDTAKIEGLILRFQTTLIPLAVANPPIGCDGTSYELEIGHPFCLARIAWWDCLPEEWVALAPIINEMAALFESSWRKVEPDAGADPDRRNPPDSQDRSQHLS